MEEYIELLTSLAPNWKVAHIVLGRESEGTRRKPRAMVWVLRVEYRQLADTERLNLLKFEEASIQKSLKARSLSKHGLEITAIEVLQSTTTANAKLWNETKVDVEAPPAANGKGSGTKEPSPTKIDPYFADFPDPKELTLADCIVDKTAHSSIAEQRLHYREEMHRMARSGHDEEDGWTKWGRTTQANVEDEHQLDIYERKVGWSSVRQSRTVANADFEVREVFEYLVGALLGDVNALLDRLQTKHEAGNEVMKASVKKRDSDRYHLFTQQNASSATLLCYMVISFPWPLSPRDYFIVQDYVLSEDGKSFFTYNHDMRHPHVALREGFTRMSVKYQVRFKQLSASQADPINP